MYVVLRSKGLGITQNPNSGFWRCHGEMYYIKRQVEQGFSSFLPYLMISIQSRAHQRHCKVLKNHQIWGKNGKK